MQCLQLRCGNAKNGGVTTIGVNSMDYFNMTWARIKDVSILSIVLILFLYYPMLTKLVLSSLKCPKVGRGSYYLLADLQERCFTGRHLHYLLAVTLPQIIAYVIGLPFAATWLIIRKGSLRLHDSESLHIRYSLLFVGYSRGREWWEVVIVARKISIVILGTFGSMTESVEKTACVALIIIFVSIIAHLLGKPFGMHTRNALRLHLLELLALFVVWFINWGGLMLYLGVDDYVQLFLTFLIVLSIVCYLVGTLLFVYLNKIRKNRHATKNGTLRPARSYESDRARFLKIKEGWREKGNRESF